MSGNTIGVLFRVTTWGESHGPATGAVIDGCPPRIDLSAADIQSELDRRRPGVLPSASPRREADRVEILSGVFEGKTTGTPIALMIRNIDADSAAYDGLRDLFRPGHGDITYQAKYGIRDHRGGGRASGRETAGRVAAGAVARKVIAQAGITVQAWTRELGGIAAEPLSLAAAETSPLRCPDPGGGKEDDRPAGGGAGRGRHARRDRGDRRPGLPAGPRRAGLRQDRRGSGGRPHGDRDRQGGGDRRGVRRRADDGLRLQRPHRSRGLPDQQRRRDPRGDHQRRRDRHPGRLQAHPLHRPPPGDRRRARDIPPS